ncbi:MAG: hypothetical protein A2541_02375 [Candidatus Taylorbacteria bacterium RIFOXYD2_FULL_36_9]|uniref:Uncharacterized protein n=1 Tax=Candidatus Taylorbacteria bacterium RIFOXYD2_FULL_36_9 TaxID=1802338 RepID=A0A1G2PGL7_9BACT|nr:MAG: hypothetical protein A2541_02375 [Candidatus Taylorbacteria bacterium RIFOXYD2_FULL_36_9]
MENEATNTISTEPKNNFGGIIGAIIIIVLIVAGGWYFIGNRVEKIQDQKQNAPIEISTGTSTEIQDIQTDLDNLDLRVLD